jgi:hypothetical protein
MLFSNHRAEKQQKVSSQRSIPMSDDIIKWVMFLSSSATTKEKSNSWEFFKLTSSFVFDVVVTWK